MNPIILYDNELDRSSLTATSESGYPAEYLKDSKTYTYWKGSSEFNNEIIIDLVSDKYIGAIALAGHNLNDIKAKITIEKSNDGSVWNEAISEFAITTNRAILKLLDSSGGEPGGDLELLQGGTINLLQGGAIASLQSESNTVRYWKIKIQSLGSPKIAVISMGAYIKLEYPPSTPTVPVLERIVANSSFSAEGHMLGADVRYHPKEANFSFSDFSGGWYKAKFFPFWNNHARWLRGFIWAWDIENRKEDVFFCTLNENSVLQEPLSRFNNVDEIQLQLKYLA